MSRSKDQLLTEMREKGLRVTPQREAILDYLLSEKSKNELIPNHVLEAYVQGQKKVIEAG